MNNADDMGFDKRADGEKILILQQQFDPANFKGISSGERIKLKHQFVYVAVEVVSCGEGNNYRGTIYAFEYSADKINFSSIGNKNNGLVVGQQITFQSEHIFFLNRRR